MWIVVNVADKTERKEFDDEKLAAAYAKSRTGYIVVPHGSSEGYIDLKINEWKTARNRERVKKDRQQANQGVKKQHRMD